MAAHESEVVETTLSLATKRGNLSGNSCKTILFVTNTNEFGGAEKHLLTLIRRLHGSGVQLSILCLGDDFFSERLDPERGVHVMTCEKEPKFLGEWTQLFRISQPDVVVFIYSWFWCLPPIAVVGAWWAGVRRRFAIQHLVLPRLEVAQALTGQLKKHRSFRNLVRWLVRRPPSKVLVPLGPLSPVPRMSTAHDLIAEQPLCVLASASTPMALRVSAYFYNTTICVSNALLVTLVKEFGFPANRMKMIHNGVSLSEFIPPENDRATIRARLGVHPDEFLLVCTARLSPQKGIDILLQAMARTVRGGVHCKCVIVGDGPIREELWAQARELDLAGRVFFEGFREDVRPYLQAASAFILTSHSEGLPLSILEAMACGLPCIVTDVGGNAEAVTNHVQGLVVPPGSVDAIADAVSYLATHPHERALMSKLALARAHEEFDVENSMTEIKRVMLG